ncbi:hypothetical protein KKF91_09975 [Myxococcota bacterium]|nr:hypothetical protein [Myxococcota bacterium]MBU1430866.1 hypothetical protein [Myxococcota bacterium]MBU1896864.1 hypothetical protein [Myxococcota bacterium]
MSAWEALLGGEAPHQVMPWVGGRRLSDGRQAWKLQGALPPAPGWYAFKLSGRRAQLIGPAEADVDFEDEHPNVIGYLIGDRLVPVDARVDPDPARLVSQSRRVYLVEGQPERFSRVITVALGEALIFCRALFPEGPELDVLAAYQAGADSVREIKGVTPALELAFRAARHLAPEEKASLY